ncbi:MAG: Mlc titration factor MtfA (ptsG expression regulator) [Algoriphagus sp.]
MFPEDWQFILQQEAQFYSNLNPEEKLLFESNIQYFLTRIRITGVKTSVNDEDRLLAVSSAVIPIIRFLEWENKTLCEILLYPDLLYRRI